MILAVVVVGGAASYIYFGVLNTYNGGMWTSVLIYEEL
jgi:hypothetical protein